MIDRLAVGRTAALAPLGPPSPHSQVEGPILHDRKRGQFYISVGIKIEIGGL